MNIWIDSGITPRNIMDKIYHLALPRRINVKVICRSVVPIPALDNIERIIVGNIQKYILEHIQYGDLAICHDLPVIEDLVNKGAAVISPLGDLFTPENITEQMQVRLEEGYHVSSPALTLKDREMFLVTFNQWLSLSGW